MESTGVYWIPVYEILEERGFEVLLVNARDVKNVPGRKTDVNDAQWLQQLHEHGLLRGSFRPREALVRLRAILRHRERMIDYAASHIQHMQKALMQMNLQLHHVVADITGQTGMRIIRAICHGRDAAVLAGFRDPRFKEPEEVIREALTGHYRPEHVFTLRQALELYDAYQAKIIECDGEIEKALAAVNGDRSMAGPCRRDSLDSWLMRAVKRACFVRAHQCPIRNPYLNTALEAAIPRTDLKVSPMCPA
jgi:transposase